MQPPPQGDYRILVRAGWERPQARLYACSIRQALPEVPVPLRQGEPEARLPLSQLLADIYARAHYDLRLDYRQPPEPALSSLSRASSAGRSDSVSDRAGRSRQILRTWRREPLTEEHVALYAHQVDSSLLSPPDPLTPRRPECRFSP